MAKGGLQSALWVVGFAVATLVVIDVGLQRLTPLPPPLLEVTDGVGALGDGDPDVLAIGSSHTRSFAPLRDAIQPGQQMVLVPVEAGSFASYEWVFAHRLRPLLKPRLRRVVFVTTFYDLCHKADHANLPGRAWTLGDFLVDVSARGLDDFNRNYLLRRMNRLFRPSVLVQTHGTDRILGDVKDRLRPAAVHEEKRLAALARWREVIEGEYTRCDDSDEKAALYRMIDDFQARHIEVVMASFPLMPSSLSDKAKATTLKRYADFLASLGRDRGVRIVDMTLTAPVADADFMDDFDHLTLPGNQRFSAWALEHDLSFLKAGP